MNGETIYPKGVFIDGKEIHGIESITFAPSELNAMEAKIYNAMEVPQTLWSGKINLKLSKKKMKAFKRFTYVKKTRIPRKQKKRAVRQFYKNSKHKSDYIKFHKKVLLTICQHYKVKF